MLQYLLIDEQLPSKCPDYCYLSPYWRSPIEFGKFISCLVHMTFPTPEAAWPRLGFASARLMASWREQLLFYFATESATRIIVDFDKLTGSVSPWYKPRYALYFLSSTKYAQPLFNPGSTRSLDTFFRFRRKFASMEQNLAWRYLIWVINLSIW